MFIGVCFVYEFALCGLVAHGYDAGVNKRIQYTPHPFAQGGYFVLAHFVLVHKEFAHFPGGKVLPLVVLHQV
jgi:hypothetical protein